MYNITFLFFIFWCVYGFGCQPNTKSPFTHTNLARAWEHYNAPEDSLKQKALVFIARHMNNKTGLDSKQAAQWNSLYHAMYQISGSNKFDSVRKVAEILPIVFIPDTASITAGQLIENIDYAFKAKNLPWAKQTSFEDFCEYILPHRIDQEPLSGWRRYLYQEHQPLIDSLVKAEVEDPEIVCKVLSDKLKERFRFHDGLGLPTPNIIDLYKNPVGACGQRYILFTAIARSLGLPVAIDFTPQTYRGAHGHQWVSLIKSNSKIRSYPFNAGDRWTYFAFPNADSVRSIIILDTGIRTQEAYFQYHGIKRYRYTYSNENKQETLAGVLSNPNVKDVTREYPLKTVNIIIPYKGDKIRQLIYLFNFGFGFKLTPMCQGIQDTNAITFKDISTLDGTTIVQAGYYHDENFIAIGNPHYIEAHTGKCTPIYPSSLKRKTIRLHRKYPHTWEEIPFHEQLKGGLIQGANTPDFANTRNLYRIDETPQHFTKYELTGNRQAFNYYRFVSHTNSEINIAELHFFVGNNQVECKQLMAPDGVGSETLAKLQDDNIHTNLVTDKGNWIGVNVSQEKSKMLHSFSILPRNSFNSIEKSHEYELFYFDEGWKSLGKQKAQTHHLDFANVPYECLLLLRDLTEGRQERMFLYDDKLKQQVFW